jgi:hypothetical protein
MKLMIRLFLYLSVCSYSFDSYGISNKSIDQNNNHQIEKGSEIYMIDFIKQQEEGLWRVTNDGVMGGLSNGKMLFEQDHGVFTGDISLDNNGGFSSVFRQVENIPAQLDKLVIVTQGDGQTYQLRLVVYIDGYRLTYKNEFNTSVNKREQIVLKLADFQATFRGRDIKNAPLLKSENIREVGFLMTKKVAGKFLLSVYQLSFLKE